MAVLFPVCLMALAHKVRENVVQELVSPYLATIDAVSVKLDCLTGRFPELSLHFGSICPASTSSDLEQPVFEHLQLHHIIDELSAALQDGNGLFYELPLAFIVFHVLRQAR